MAMAMPLTAAVDLDIGVGIGVRTVRTIRTIPIIRTKSLPNLPRPLAGQSAGVSHGALLVIGGTDFPEQTKVWFDGVHVLERDATAWRTPFHLAHPLGYAAAATLDDLIVVAGGSDATHHYAEAFTLEWSEGGGGRVQQRPLPPLPAPVAMAGGARIGRTFFIAGGQRHPTGTEALREVWSIDLAESAPSWRALPPIPGAGRILPIVAAQGGQLIVASGAELHRREDGSAGRRYLTDAYAYAWTPSRSAGNAGNAGNAGSAGSAEGTGTAGSWRRSADVPRPAVAAPALAFGSTQIIVLGGDDGVEATRIANGQPSAQHPGFNRDILSYDTTTGAWSTLGALPAGFALVTTMAMRRSANEDVDVEMVIPGGEDRPRHRSSAVVAISGINNQHDDRKP